MYEFTIIVPVYNEEENLLRVEKELSAYIRTAALKTSVLFVNDGSKDRSQRLIDDICKRNEAFHFISFKENLGLSVALKAGFEQIESPIIGYIDSDLQTDPQDFNLLLAHLGEYDLVTGVRSDRKDKLVKNLSSKFANTSSGTLNPKTRAISPPNNSAINAFTPWPAPRNFKTYLKSSSPSANAGKEPPSRNGVM